MWMFTNNCMQIIISCCCFDLSVSQIYAIPFLCIENFVVRFRHLIICRNIIERIFFFFFIHEYCTFNNNNNTKAKREKNYMFFFCCCWNNNNIFFLEAMQKKLSLFATHKHEQKFKFLLMLLLFLLHKIFCSP